MITIRYILNRLRRLTPVLIMSLFTKPRKHAEIPADPKSIIIMSQDKLGDLILLTPLLSTWKKHFPHSHLSVVVTNRNLAMAKQLKDPDEVFVLKNNPSKLKQLRKGKEFDILFNPKDHCSRSQLLWTALIPAKIKLGFKAFLTDRFYDHTFYFNENANVIEKNLEIFKLYDIKLSEDDLLPELPFKDDSKAREFFKDIKGTLIGLNFSAGEKARQYDPAKWIEIIEDFNHEDISFILFGIDEMVDITREIAAKYKNVFRPEGIRDLLEMNNYIKALDVLITPDTSVFHLGYAAKTNTIGLFQNRKINLNRFGYKTRWVTTILSPDVEVAEIDSMHITKEIRSFLSSQ